MRSRGRTAGTRSVPVWRGTTRATSRRSRPSPRPSSAAYSDLADDLPVGTEARLLRPQVEPLPKGWEEIRRFTLLQMVAQRPPEEVELSAAVLSQGDAPAMMDLVAATEPGPFARRTPLLGSYLGIRDGRSSMSGRITGRPSPCTAALGLRRVASW
jgi:hypothetical protein